MSSVTTRLRAPLRSHRDQFVFCPEDGFWFRPLYSEGKCPVCGKTVADPGPAPLLVRFDRFSLGLAALGIVSLGMTVLVLVMYFT